MKKFIVTYHAPAELMERSQESSQEEIEAGIKAWMNWANGCGKGLVDLGNPLMGGERLNPDGSSLKSTTGVCGYSILQADNMEGAKALLNEHPHLAWNGACTIEVHESLPLPESKPQE